MSQLLEIYFAFAFIHIDRYMCKKTTLEKLHLIVKVDLVVVVYYLKLLFCLLYDKGIKTAGALP